MKRHRELMGSGLDFAPVRLLGGFICVDSHIGCSGCTWCLNRRHSGLHRLLNKGLHMDLADTGISIDEMVSLIRALPSFRKARVPIRFGHLTDWRYETTGVRDMLERLPKDYPAVVMTRYPLDGRQRKTLSSRPNLLAHITLTPHLSIGDRDYVNPETVIASVRGLPPSRVFFMLRPLVSASRDACMDIMEKLPADSHIGFRALSIEGIPGISGLSPISGNDIDALRKEGAARLLHVLDFFGCMMRKNLGIPFFKYPEASRMPDTACVRCANQTTCAAVPDPDLSVLKNELDFLEIVDAKPFTERDRIAVKTEMFTARAEEVYLSEAFGREILFSTVARSERKERLYMNEAVWDRWERTGFFPVREMREMSGQILAAVEGKGLYVAE